MPTKDKITEEMYLRCKDMLGRLLTDTNLLGAGYVIQLVKTRNTINRNSYDSERVIRSVYAIVESRVVESLYIKIFGEAPGYKIFETECLVYLEYMKRLWGVS